MKVIELKNMIMEIKKETCQKDSIGERRQQDRIGELEYRTTEFTDQSREKTHW